MENRYILATDTFDNKVFSVCVFDREKEHYVVLDSVSSEKEFEKKVKKLSKQYNTVPIKEYDEKSTTVNRYYAEIPRLEEAIIHYFKGKGNEKLLKYLHEEDAIDYMLIEEILNFAKNENK
jgi:hypothetical protein